MNPRSAWVITRRVRGALRAQLRTAQVANSLVQEYLGQNYEQTTSTADVAYSFLRNEEARLKQKLEQSENAMQDYKEETKSVSLEDRQNVVVEKLKELNQKVTEAKSQRILQETAYNQATQLGSNPAALIFLQAVANDPTVVDIRGNIARLESDLANLRQRYKAKHPKYMQAASQLVEWKSSLTNAVLTNNALTNAVLSNVEWSVLYGDAIGLLGPNGAGKSTLLKSIVGELPLQSGELHRANGLRVGYFAQHQVDRLRLDESALWHLARIAAGEREQELRNHLGGFDFRGDQVFQRVADLSGGEKARLALALIVWERPNLLLLDEPTNHLDIEMREALAESLQDFEGALIVVAHDRHLLEAATDQWWLVAEGGVRSFEGDLDDYKEWSRQYRMRLSGREGGAKTDDRKAQRRSEAQTRQRLADARKPFEKKLRTIDGELEALRRELTDNEAWLASDGAYAETNRERLQSTSRRQTEILARVEALENDWLWIQAELDAEVNRLRG